MSNSDQIGPAGRKRLFWFISPLFFLLASASMAAEWKPEKNVEFVIGTGAGGALDRTARLIQRIWKNTGIVPATTLVVNKPGGGQSMALGYLDQNARDGHYLLITSGIVFSNHITGKSPHAYTNFTPVAILFSEGTVFAVSSGSSIRTANDLISRLRKDPYGPSFAVGSTLGSATHIASALVGKAVGADIKRMKAVVFNSSGESVTAVMGGHVDVMAAAAQLAVQHSKTGKLRIVASATSERLPGALSVVPTWKELGVDAIVTNWRGVFGPRDMSPEQVSYWVDALQKTEKNSEWQDELSRNLMVSTFYHGLEAKKFLDSDYATTKLMLTELGMTK